MYFYREITMSKFSEFLKDSKKISVSTTVYNEKKIEEESVFKKTLCSVLKKAAYLALLTPLVANAGTYQKDFSPEKTQHINDTISLFSAFSDVKPLPPDFVEFQISDKNTTYSYHDLGNGGSCNIVISVDNNGEFLKLDQSDEKLYQGKYQDFYQEFVLNHEMAHCIDNKTFKAEGLSKNAMKWLNDWYVGEHVTMNPVKEIFEENFSDSYAALVFLNNHDFSDESVNFLKEWKKAREKINLSNEQMGTYIDGHNTYQSVQLITENIDKIKKIDRNKYKNIAEDLASQSVLYQLNKNRKVEDLFEVDDLGNIVPSGKKKALGREGVSLLKNVFDNYKESIQINSNVIIYDLKNENPQLTNLQNSAIFDIALKGVNFFNEDGVNFDVKDLSKRVSTQLKGNYYDNIVENYKNNNKYSEFVSEINSYLTFTKPKMKFNDPTKKLEQKQEPTLNSLKIENNNRMLKK